MTARPKAKLTRGAAWAADVRERYELNESDEVYVDLVADSLDALDSGKLTAPGKRAEKIVLLRALGALGLPPVDAGSEARRAETTRRASRAARARWQREAG